MRDEQRQPSEKPGDWRRPDVRLIRGNQGRNVFAAARQACQRRQVDAGREPEMGIDAGHDERVAQDDLASLDRRNRLDAQ